MNNIDVDIFELHAHLVVHRKPYTVFGTTHVRSSTNYILIPSSAVLLGRVWDATSKFIYLIPWKILHIALESPGWVVTSGWLLPLSAGIAVARTSSASVYTVDDRAIIVGHTGYHLGIPENSKAGANVRYIKCSKNIMFDVRRWQEVSITLRS